MGKQVGRHSSNNFVAEYLILILRVSHHMILEGSYILFSTCKSFCLVPWSSSNHWPLFSRGFQELHDTLLLFPSIEQWTFCPGRNSRLSFAYQALLSCLEACLKQPFILPFTAISFSVPDARAVQKFTVSYLKILCTHRIKYACLDIESVPWRFTSELLSTDRVYLYRKHYQIVCSLCTHRHISPIVCNSFVG